MLRFFHANNPLLLVLLLLYALILRLPLFIYPEAYSFTDMGGGPLTRLVAYVFERLLLGNYYVIAVFSVILVYLQALLFNRLINTHKIFDRITYVPALSFILVSSLLPEWLLLSPPMLAGLCLLVIFSMLFVIYKQHAAFRAIFDIGFMIAIATLFYFPSIAWLVLFLIGLGILRTFNWREWVVGVSGVLTPILLLFTYYFLTDKLGIYWEQEVMSHMVLQAVDLPLGKRLFVAGGYLVLLSVLSGGAIVIHYNNSPIQHRKYFTLILWSVPIAIASFLLGEMLGWSHFWLLVAPLAFIISFFWLSFSRFRIPEISYWIFLLLLLFFQYFPHLRGA